MEAGRGAAGAQAAARGSVNLGVAAIARKLTVAIWYLMMGRWTTLSSSL